MNNMDKLLETLRSFELTGQSLIVEELGEEKKERVTSSGIVLTGETNDGIDLKKGLVRKAGKGYISEHGAWIPNLIQEGAVIYYKAAGEYTIEGTKFKGTEIGQVVAYKNATNAIGQKVD
jgi:co-chaperonin GroES (HSP10)